MAQRPRPLPPRRPVQRIFARTRLAKLIEVENPTARAPYLVDPDYYRIGYQMVAQQLNSLHAVSQEEESSAAGGDLGDALVEAKKLLSQSFGVREWLRHRSEAPGWRLWNPKLTPREKRLCRFLSETVEPCLEIAIAATERHEDQRPDPESVERLRQQAKKGTLSYRALYNLACYKAGAKGGGSEGLEYLRQALRKASVDRVAELLRWATKDPSLARLRRTRGFSDLRREFEL